MITKLYEYVLSNENFSRYYYLVLRFNEETFQPLIDCKMEKLVGISDNVGIIPSFFDIRDLLLIMDKKSVEDLNDVEKVNYESLDYLCEDSFKVLKRLAQVPTDSSINSLIYQGFRKCEYYKHKKNLEINNQLHKLEKIKNNNISVFKYLDDNSYKILKNIEKTIDFNDFMEQVYKSLDVLKSGLDKKIVRYIFEYVIIGYGILFKNEGEVFVKNEIFNIPEKSVLLIKEQNPNSYTFDEHKVILDKYIDELKKIYRVKQLKYKQGKIIDDTHKISIPIIRYLDKINF